MNLLSSTDISLFFLIDFFIENSVVLTHQNVLQADQGNPIDSHCDHIHVYTASSQYTVYYPT